jgi:hypothetical protein
VNSALKKLPSSKQKNYRQRHFRHRLTLLRCFASRRANNFDWNSKGDLFRCAKDSALISIRLFLNSMGLRGDFDSARKDFVLKKDDKLRRNRRGDDILIDQLGGRLPDPRSWSLSAEEARLLAGVYKRANKELAHLTETFNEEFNKEEAIDRASRLVERLLNECLYSRVNERMPDMDV